MRLLHTQTLRIEEFGGSDLPFYAIFSHKWDANEVTMQDMQRGDADQKPGYKKVSMTCEIAKNHGLDYVWIDTCCIDKTSSAELSEAINSMYRWYQEAVVCYAYLADVPSNDLDKFSKSAWFTRGWTLQELIAPSIVIFLDKEWKEIGTKNSLQELISKTTGVPEHILQGADIGLASVAERMSWASYRKTTRVEDVAYCLMGMFGINMPMLYGEGERAFIRLQEEIMKISDDHTLFAWASTDGGDNFLATSPAAFSKSSEITMVDSSSNLTGTITVNNMGLHLHLCFMDIERPPSQRVRLAILPCVVKGSSGTKAVGIYLEALPGNKQYFKRVEVARMDFIHIDDQNRSKYIEESICVRRWRQILVSQSMLVKAAENGHEAVVKLLLEKGANPDHKALQAAANRGSASLVKILLESGAIPDHAVLEAAVRSKNAAVVRLFILHEAGVDTCKVSLGTDALPSGSEENEAMSRLFRDVKANIQRRVLSNLAKVTSMMLRVMEVEIGGKLRAAAKNGDEEGVRSILKACTGLNENIVEVAAEKGHDVAVMLLLEGGANQAEEEVCSMV